MTARSYALYDRIYKHNLTFLIPSELIAAHIEYKNGFEYVEFVDTSSNADQNVVMAFTDDAVAKKLDLPETFRMGFGENWTQTLDMVEQSYLLARQYYGEEQSVQMIKALTKKTN